MRSLNTVRRILMVFLLSAVFALPAAALDAPNIPADLADWPTAALLQGTRINMRAGPSTKEALRGQFADETDAGEMLVLEARDTGEAYLWFRVQTERLGEGWIYGKYLRIEPNTDPVARYCRRLRRDFGINRALAETLYGNPDRISKQTRKLEDWNITIRETTLVFHGHTAIYWNYNGRDMLRTIELRGGWQGFGDLLVHTSREEVLEKLGKPHYEEGALWRYHWGMEEIHITFIDASIGTLRYEKALFD